MRNKSILALMSSFIILITSCGLPSVNIAGDYEKSGFKDGNFNEALFNEPGGITADSKGNIFVADTKNHRIRKITPDGKVSTFAGSEAGYQDGKGSEAKFKEPIGITVDKDDNLFVSDRGNYVIRKITNEGMVSTFAGTPGKNTSNLDTDLGYLSKGISIHDEFIYTTEGSAIKIISPEGRITKFEHVTRAGEISNPQNIVFSSDGEFIFNDYDSFFGHGEILKSRKNTSGKKSLDPYDPENKNDAPPYSITIDEKDNLYCIYSGGNLYKIPLGKKRELLSYLNFNVNFLYYYKNSLYASSNNSIKKISLTK